MCCLRARGRQRRRQTQQRQTETLEDRDGHRDTQKDREKQTEGQRRERDGGRQRRTDRGGQKETDTQTGGTQTGMEGKKKRRKERQKAVERQKRAEESPLERREAGRETEGLALSPAPAPSGGRTGGHGEAGPGGGPPSLPLSYSCPEHLGRPVLGPRSRRLMSPASVPSPRAQPRGHVGPAPREGLAK